MSVTYKDSQKILKNSISQSASVMWLALRRAHHQHLFSLNFSYHFNLQDNVWAFKDRQIDRQAGWLTDSEGVSRSIRESGE